MFSAFEVDPAHLVGRFIEGFQLMKACWTEPRITFERPLVALDGAAVEPKPFQKPHPPLWIGGNHPRAVRRAVRYGDDFFGAGSSTTAQFAQQVQVLRAARAEAQQVPTNFQVAKCVYIAIDDDATRARERVEGGLTQIYGASSLNAVAVYGPPSVCARSLRRGPKADPTSPALRRYRADGTSGHRSHPTTGLKKRNTVPFGNSEEESNRLL